jgi:sugar phosphate isomerase/epimerase
LTTGAEHVEIVPFGFQLVDNEPLIDAIREKAAALNLPISNYAILADLLKGDEAEFEREVQRLLKEVDIAHRLGVKLDAPRCFRLPQAFRAEYHCAL